MLGARISTLRATTSCAWGKTEDLLERPLSGSSGRAFAQHLALSKVLGTQELPSWRHAPPLLPQCLRLGIPGSRVQGEDSSQGAGEVKTARGGELGSESGEGRQEDCQ